MRATIFTEKKFHIATAALLFFTSVLYCLPAHSANATCTPTTSTVGNLTVLEFVNPNTSESNTTGSNTGYTCDWTVPSNVYSVSVVIVGGGGSGGFGNQAGGGGGGEVMYTTSDTFTTPSSIKTITVGTGGAATTAAANIRGNSGANSSYDGVIARGGGGGGSGGPSPGTPNLNLGLTGGSSGGGSRFVPDTVTAPTKTSAPGFTSLANAGGKGAGKQDNVAATSSTCGAFGSGGGGGGAMSAGGNASASCSDSSTAGSINITVGTGGAGAYLLGKCVGGGGASLYGNGADNKGTLTVVEAPKTPCKDPKNNNQDVAGTFSGGGSGANIASGAANTGGGGSGAPLDYNRPRGGSGVVLIAYDPTNPPVAPNITTQPQSKTVSSMNTETLTVAANINDGGALSYLWQSAPNGSTTFTNIANSDSSTLVTSALPPSSTGIQYRVRITNTKSSQTTTTTSNVATLTVNRRSTTLSLSYPDSNTARFFTGETLTATYSSNSDSASAITFTSPSSASICTVNRSTGVIAVAGAGQCAIQISVPASDRYAAATLSISVTIRPPLQVVTWSSLPSLAVSSPAIQLGTSQGYPLATGETTTGAGTIVYSLVSSCSSFSITASGRITPIALGSCAIRALQQATATFDAGSTIETLTVVATPPNAPFINSASSSGGTSPTSGAITVSLTSSNENGASITQYVATATPSVGSAIQETLTAGSGNRTITISGLTLGTSYSVSAVAINSAGRSSARTYSTNLTPAGIPYGVSGLSATPGDTTLTINYTAPANLNGGTWVRYEYFITPSGTPFSDTPTATNATQATTSNTFTGLTNGQGYDVKVVALTSANGSASSVNTTLLNLVPAVAPQAPTISVSRLSDTSARVNWYSTSDGGSPITSYTITVTKNSVAQSCYTNLATKTCTISGLNATDQISASATASNIIGTSTSSATVSYTHSAAPLSPTGITTTSGDTNISISFTQPSSGDSISDYEYSFDGTTFISFGTNVSPVLITGLTNETSYDFFIRAIGTSYGAGAISETITAIAGIPAPPPPPPPSGGGGGGGSYTPPVVVQETKTVVVVETPTVIIIVETSTQVTTPKSPEVRIPITETTTVVTKISIRMEEAFNINSYFVNVVATNELEALIKKYSKRDIIKVLTIGYASPSKFNPYPDKLGRWRAEAIAKTMRKLGLKTEYDAKYGGLYKNSSKDSRKVRIVFYIKEIVVTIK